VSVPLYNAHILKLATSTAKFARLIDAEGSAERRSPTCGSRVTVDVRLRDDGTVDALGLEVRACALGQASAALMAANAAGKNAADLHQARDALAQFLGRERSDPGTWPGLNIFEPAQAHRARHPSILLAFDAVIGAVAAAR
jgi:NifU-like protein involved in Fe-S cluster formation